MKRTTDILQAQLELRRAWVGDTAGTGAGLRSFNDADLVFVGFLAHVFGASFLVVTTEQVYGALLDAYSRLRPQERVTIERWSDGNRPASTSLVLTHFEDAAIHSVEERATDTDCLVVTYGWGSPWEPAKLRSAEWNHDTLFVPTFGVSPALWRSSIQLMVSRPRLAEAEEILTMIGSILNDQDFDTLLLLEKLQTLELKLREKRPTPQPGPAVLQKKDGDAASVERELLDLRRTLVLQQMALATAYAQLSRLQENGPRS
jgi:hypothetical protein